MPTRLPVHLSHLNAEQRAEFEDRIGAFERAWQRGDRPRIADSLPADPDLRKPVLLELVRIERELRIKAGEPASLESYLRDFPELAGDLAADPQATTQLGESSTMSHGESSNPPNARLCDRIGRYKIARVLGTGGFGTVYLGYDEELQRHVAVKVILARPVATDDVLFRDGRIPAKLDHANIVPVHDMGRTADGSLYVVSKYIEGTNLRVRMQQKFSAPEAAELVAIVAEALHYAHTQGVVHRDIKPENILIDGKRRPYVADFGIALREEEVGKGSGSKLIGTPAYMSPEQTRGEGHLVDGRSDVFSLGVVFYELLTGVNPFRAANWAKSILQIATVEAKPPRQIDDSIPKKLESICLKALSKRPSDRFPTATDFAEELRQFLKRDHDRNRGGARSSEAPRVFGVGVRKLSQGQYGCALVVGTLALLLAALPVSFRYWPGSPQPGTVADSVPEHVKAAPVVKVGQPQESQVSNPYRPPSAEGAPRIAKKGDSTDVVPQEPAPALPLRAQRPEESGPAIAGTSRSLVNPHPSNPQQAPAGAPKPSRPMKNPAPVVVQKVPAQNSDLTTLETLAGSCLTANEALALYNRFNATRTMSTEQEEKYKASVRVWEDRSEQNLARLGEKWIPAEAAASAHKEAVGLVAQAFEMIKIPDFKEARKTLETANRIDPNSIAADFTLGLLNSITPTELRSPQTAANNFQVVLQRVPGYVPALNNLAIAELRQKKFADAVRNLRKAAERSPQSKEVTQNLARFISEANLGRIRPSKSALAEATRLYAKLVPSKQGTSPERKVGWQFMPFVSSNGERVILPNLSYDDHACSACNGSRHIPCPAPGCVHGFLYDETLVHGSSSSPVAADNVATAQVRRTCPTCGGAGFVPCPHCRDGIDPTLH
jgi:serine/threonine protein kinase/Flp pilus assembly protein TadD